MKFYLKLLSFKNSFLQNNLVLNCQIAVKKSMRNCIILDFWQMKNGNKRLVLTCANLMNPEMLSTKVL